MYIISYDITNNKLRTNLAKFIEKWGNRKQYSVWEIDNSPRILRIIKEGINFNFKKKFKNTDSVIIFYICSNCQKKIIKFGKEKLESNDVIIL